MGQLERLPTFEERVQKLGEERLLALYAIMDDEPSEDSPASAPFCGCATCTVREVLDAVWDEMIAEARREVLNGHGHRQH